MVGLGLGGRLRCELIINSWLPLHDPPGLGACRLTVHDTRPNKKCRGAPL